MVQSQYRQRAGQNVYTNTQFHSCLWYDVQLKLFNTGPDVTGAPRGGSNGGRPAGIRGQVIGPGPFGAKLAS